MGDDDHGLALPGQAQHHVQHLPDHLRVQGRRHLVKEQDLRVHTQGPDDGHPLLLAAGELAGILVLLLQQTHPAQQGPGLLPHLLPGRFQHFAGGQENVVHYRQVGKELIALEHHADAAAQGGQIFGPLADDLAV